MNVRGRNKLPCPHCGRGILFDFGISKDDRARRSGADGVGIGGLDAALSDDEALWAAESSEEDLAPRPPWQAATDGDLSSQPLPAHLTRIKQLPTVDEVREREPMPPPVPLEELEAEMAELRRRIKLAKQNHPSAKHDA